MHHDKIKLIHSSHTTFPEEIKSGTVRLIVYNLGYLPGSDKALTTKVETTLESINHAQRLIMEGGVISVTCYPGHPEGKKEEEELQAPFPNFHRNNGPARTNAGSTATKPLASY